MLILATLRSCSSRLNTTLRPLGVERQSILGLCRLHQRTTMGRPTGSNGARELYSHCKTCIVDLTSLDIPDEGVDADYISCYKTCISFGSKKTDSNALNLRDAINSIRYGIAPPVAFPTETVYGLGADATNEAATVGIFTAKGRPADNPLIVHAGSVSHLEHLLQKPLPDVYKAVVDRFWPGPLTILLPIPDQAASNSNILFAPSVHPGQKTIGFRVPSSKYARFFILACDRPIAGPSANSSGKPSPTTAAHVLEDMKGKINFILDGGPCEVGVESTVVDGLHDPPLILRPGGVSLEELRAIGGKWSETQIGYKQQEQNASTTNGTNGSLEDSHTPKAGGKYVMDLAGAPRAPGMKYVHYAPRARLVLFSPEAVANGAVARKVADVSQIKSNSKIGFLSRRWPIFAGIKTITTSQVHRINGQTSLDERPLLNLLTSAEYSTSSSSGIPHGHGEGHGVQLHNLSLGTDIRFLATHLFGALRFFDTLGCDFIFAEMVSRNEKAQYRGGVDRQPNDHDQTSPGDDSSSLIDAVIDRIDKAASERIET